MKDAHHILNCGFQPADSALKSYSSSLSLSLDSIVTLLGVLLSQADAECDRMQSLLRKAAASAGLKCVHLEEMSTAALLF